MDLLSLWYQGGLWSESQTKRKGQKWFLVCSPGDWTWGFMACWLCCADWAPLSRCPLRKKAIVKVGSWSVKTVHLLGVGGASTLHWRDNTVMNYFCCKYFFIGLFLSYYFYRIAFSKILFLAKRYLIKRFNIKDEIFFTRRKTAV